MSQYDINISWLEGRLGFAESAALDDGILVATPPEFKGGIDRIWSPEHLFVASAASCFMTTFLAIAEKSRLEFLDFSCKSTAILEKEGQQLIISRISLQPVLQVANVDSVAKGLKVLELSHQSCLVLHSIKSEVIFTPCVSI